MPFLHLCYLSRNYLPKSANIAKDDGVKRITACNNGRMRHKPPNEKPEHRHFPKSEMQCNVGSEDNDALAKASALLSLNPPTGSPLETECLGEAPCASSCAAPRAAWPNYLFGTKSMPPAKGTMLYELQLIFPPYYRLKAKRSVAVGPKLRPTTVKPRQQRVSSIPAPMTPSPRKKLPQNNEEECSSTEEKCSTQWF